LEGGIDQDVVKEIPALDGVELKGVSNDEDKESSYCATLKL
jgi:hypothetical protein